MTLRLMLLGLVLSACAGTNPGGDAGAGGGTGVDPFASVRNAANGEILCDGDNCCIGRCGQSDRICVSRDPVLLAERFAGLGCPSLLFPQWFYEYNCYLFLDDSRVSTPSDTGKARLYAFVECVCGRSGTAYASDYSWANLFEVDQCEAPLVWLGEDPLPMLQRCGTPADPHRCGACQPTCGIGKECGSNGCGGSCGNCPPGEECAGGTCGARANACAGCLSACRGYSGCCTGCGCLCERDCGGCF